MLLAALFRESLGIIEIDLHRRPREEDGMKGRRMGWRGGGWDEGEEDGMKGKVYSIGLFVVSIIVLFVLGLGKQPSSSARPAPPLDTRSEFWWSSVNYYPSLS
jgi:hypothetical protein